MDLNSSQLEEKTHRLVMELARTGRPGKRELANVPFIYRLYAILEARLYPELLVWAKGGTGFVVLDETEFTRQVLRPHFQHNHFASFTRALNAFHFSRKSIRWFGLVSGAQASAQQQQQQQGPQGQKQRLKQGEPPTAAPIEASTRSGRRVILLYHRQFQTNNVQAFHSIRRNQQTVEEHHKGHEQDDEEEYDASTGQGTGPSQGSSRHPTSVPYPPVINPAVISDDWLTTDDDYSYLSSVPLYDDQLTITNDDSVIASAGLPRTGTTATTSNSHPSAEDQLTIMGTANTASDTQTPLERLIQAQEDLRSSVSALHDTVTEQMPRLVSMFQHARRSVELRQKVLEFMNAIIQTHQEGAVQDDRGDVQADEVAEDGHAEYGKEDVQEDGEQGGHEGDVMNNEPSFE